MTKWIPTDDSRRYGVVLYNYNEDGPQRIKLYVGDTVNIVEENADWYRGNKSGNRLVKGIFPKNYVHIKESVVEKAAGLYETISPKEPPIIQEVTSVLREWSLIWKQLFTQLHCADFEEVRKMMVQLVEWRRLIMERKLTMDEMKDLHHKVTSKIDMGNAVLYLDQVVREEEGNTLNPASTSTVELYKKHESAMKRTERQNSDKRGKEHTSGSRNMFNLFVNVKNFVCRVGEDADVLMTLYDAKLGCFFSESYIVQWGNQGMPKNLDMLNNLRVIFTDLGTRELEREKIYLVCQIIRIGRMLLKDHESRKQTQSLRRPFGVAAMDVTDIVHGRIESDEDKQFFIPFDKCKEGDNIYNCIQTLLGGKEVNHKGQGLWVCLKRLDGDLKQVREDYPHMLPSSTATARKMGFPEVIMPGDVRNDIYITLMLGEFNKGTRSPPNVEVVMCVCNQQGAIVENVISTGAGGSMTSEYRSVIYYHEDKPKWFETVKVAVPIEEFKKCHLKFTFKHRSSFEANDKSEKAVRTRSLAYVRMMQENGTTLTDNVHNLLVYKFIPKVKEEGPIYLKLPSTRQELELKSQPNIPTSKMKIQAGPLSLEDKDHFQICTLVCSTKLTHNVDLLGLLKWRDNMAGLKNHLMALMKVDGEEVVKFIQDVLDALFNILMQNSDSDLYDNLVFDALVFIINLISDRKYHQFRPVLDVYIKENFSATLAYNKLMVVLKYYIDNACEKAYQESLYKAMKALEYIFKFIIRSRVLFAALNEGRGKQQFEISMKQLFHAFTGMMTYTTDMTLRPQGGALKYLPTTIGDVVTVFNHQELSHLLVEFINKVPKERLKKQKMQCCNDIVHSKLFVIPECRGILMPMVLSNVKELLEKREELDVCANILMDIMEVMHRPDVGSTEKDMMSILLTLLRTIIQTVISIDRRSPYIRSFVSVLTAILRQMSEFHYNQYINHFKTAIDLLDFLMEILMVFRDLGSKNVYPHDWNEMIMLQNSVFLKSLRYFSHTIRDKFSKPFEYQLWNNFFHCAIAFLTQESLQLENFTSSKRAKIISRYKDMRREAGFEIRSMWFNLGQHKLQFIPDIVGPFLEMTLIPETELRKATIPIFFDMMQCEVMQIPAGRKAVKGNFNQVENEVITQLDALVEGGRGDEQYKDLFHDIMYALCEGHSTMKETGLAFVELVKQLLQHLLEYRTIIHDESKENRMSCIVNLLNFYLHINRQEMYIRYLHKLCDLHLECDNYTEAAHTLMLYAKLLHWSDEPLPQLMQSDKYKEAQTHRELKERLYYDMIAYFDQGKMWEKGIELCKELAHQYENETFDFIQLSAVLKRQAECYDRIMKQMRPEPEYFRVGYYGRGFPSFLQNRVFIYRGNEYERLQDFVGRLQNQFPHAQLLKTLATPGPETQESMNQYMQIYALNPIFESKKRFAGKSVSDQIQKYYKVNEVQKFVFSRRINEASNDVTTMWLERSKMETSHPLPGILRWFPVIHTHKYEVSPLEIAIETMETTNEMLKSLINQHRSDSSLRIDPLSMKLNGMVDPAVNGGIFNYKNFFSDEFASDLASKTLVQKLRELTTEQMSLLRAGLEMHSLRAPTSLRPFHQHMEQRFTQMKDLVAKHYGIKVAESRKVERAVTMPPLPRNDDLKLEIPGEKNELSYQSQSSKAPSAVRSQSVWVKPDSSSKLRGSSNSLNNSQDGTEETTKDTGSPVIELNQRLTPLRPPRPESRPASTHLKSPSPRNTQKTGSVLSVASSSASNRSTGSSSSPTASMVSSRSTISTLSIASAATLTHSDSESRDDLTATTPDEPPPLPEKHSYADYFNTSMEDVPPVPGRANSALSPTSHKNKPPQPLPEEDDVPPPMPPKKPHRLGHL